MDKDFITIRKVCSVLKISPHTVTKLIDRGILKGERTPGSLHRRIHKNNIIDFCLKHNYVHAIPKLNGSSVVVGLSDLPLPECNNLIVEYNPMKFADTVQLHKPSFLLIHGLASTHRMFQEWKADKVFYTIGLFEETIEYATNYQKILPYPITQEELQKCLNNLMFS